MQCFIRAFGGIFGGGGSGSVLSALCLPGLSELQVGVYEHVSLPCICSVLVHSGAVNTHDFNMVVCTLASMLAKPLLMAWASSQTVILPQPCKECLPASEGNGMTHLFCSAPASQVGSLLKPRDTT